MKRCPTCKRTFSDTHLIFCTDDGTPLLEVVDDKSEETVVKPSARNEASGPSVTKDAEQPAYQPPGSYLPGANAPQRKTWPWVVAILVICLVAIAGLGIAAAVFVPRMLRASRNPVNINVRSSRLNNTNLNSNSNSNTNLADNSNDDNSNADPGDENLTQPTDEEQVLTQLTDLENEWTVANINADKKKLNRILADDYVGTTNGKSQGKAEYLQTIERDDTIQKWNFEDLKVKLTGDRATLTGIIRLQVNGEEVVFNFTDKFVWRDGRWQATGSEVSPVKDEQ